MVTNSVSAPATASATNTNSDNDMITNTAANAGGRKRKKRWATIIDQTPPYLLPVKLIKPTRASDIKTLRQKVTDSFRVQVWS